MIAETLYAIGALASGVAACLAWIAKLKWSKEFAEAKDEIIKAKEAQIQVLQSQLEGLRELSPMKIKEYVDSSQELLERYIDQLKEQLQVARVGIQSKEDEIHRLQGAGATQAQQIQDLRLQKAALEETTRTLASNVASLEKDVDSRMFSIDPDLISASFSSSSALSHLGTPSIKFKPRDVDSLKEFVTLQSDLKVLPVLRLRRARRAVNETEPREESGAAILNTTEKAGA